MNDKPKTKRRWFQYSLRTLLVVVMIASAGFGWLGVKLRAKQREREAVKVIRALSAIIAYDYQYDSNRNLLENAIPPGPTSLRKLLGDDFFANVVVVAFGPLTTDADLRNVAGLSQLTTIELSETQVTDAGLIHLRGLTNLQQLSLYDTQVTDAGAEQFQKMLPSLTIYR